MTQPMTVIIHLSPRPASDFCPPLKERGMTSQQSDAAKAAACAALITAAGHYNLTNPVFTADKARYLENLALWTHRSNVMPEGDFNAAYNFLYAAYEFLNTQSINVTAAYDHIGTGDALVAAGDNAIVDMQKIANYNSGKQHYETSDADSTVADNAHGPFVTKSVGFEAIIQNYGLV